MAVAVMPCNTGALATMSALPVPSGSRLSAGSYRLSSSLSSPTSYYTSEYRSKYSSPVSSTSSVTAYSRRHLSLSDVDSGLGSSSRLSTSSYSVSSVSSASSRERSESREPAYVRASSRSRLSDAASTASSGASRAARSTTSVTSTHDAIQDLYNKYSPSNYLADRPPRPSPVASANATAASQRYSTPAPAPSLATSRTSEVIGRQQSPASSTGSSPSSSEDETPAAAGVTAASGDEPPPVAEIRRRFDAAVAPVAAPTVSVKLPNGTRVRRRIVVTAEPEEDDASAAASPVASTDKLEESPPRPSTSGCPSPSLRPPEEKSKGDSSEEESSSDEDERPTQTSSFIRRRPGAAIAGGSRLSGELDLPSSPRLSRGHGRVSGVERGGLAGLRNIGNTCFMNSVIQCLSNTKPLLEYLLNNGYLSDLNVTVSSMKGALIKAFSTVIQELWQSDSNGMVVNTTALKSQIQRFAPRFMGYSQQDAQEFLRYLLEGLHEDVNRVTVRPKSVLKEIDESLSDQQKAAEAWKRYLRVDDSKIVDIFVGQLKSTLRCTMCGHCSVTFDPFWDLSLPIPIRTGQVRLQQCLESFTREEVLDGDEKPTCSKCQMRRKCTKSFTIQKFPKILVLHLKRFSPTERFRGKLSVTVDFPLTGLDLSAYAANRGQGCTYNLYGIANHSGTTYSGHYTAYCKHPYNNDWHEYNDSRVSAISSRSVVSSEAYVLFYELYGHSSHL